MQVQCSDFTVSLDNSSGDIAFLSHAHSDHIFRPRRNTKIIASEATLNLAQIEHTSTEHSQLKMIDAGHILGARQLIIDSDGKRTVYTGDFSLKKNIFGLKADIPTGVDHLIMEATYGSPEYTFPDPSEIHHQIQNWVLQNPSKNLLFGCYELGKAQEVIKVLNEISICPIVTEKTNDFCSVYDKHGYLLNRALVGSELAEELMKHSFVAILPMSKAKRYFAARLSEAFSRPTLCAAITGWAKSHSFNTDTAFSLSDHADFNDLVYYVEQSGAKSVEFFCGNGEAVLQKTQNSMILNK